MPPVSVEVSVKVTASPLMLSVKFATGVPPVAVTVTVAQLLDMASSRTGVLDKLAGQPMSGRIKFRVEAVVDALQAAVKHAADAYNSLYPAEVQYHPEGSPQGYLDVKPDLKEGIEKRKQELLAEKVTIHIKPLADEDLEGFSLSVRDLEALKPVRVYKVDGK